MQEFSSISVSSYEAGSLADKLTEQSTAGWHVVSIVAAGSNITAYLSRPAGTPAIVAGVEALEAEGSDPSAATTPDSSPAVEPTLPVASVSNPVDEPAGWAVEPEPATPTAESSPFEVASEVSAMPETTASSTPAATGATDASSPESTPASTTESTTAGAAPAGWYADPSSRFELRYWDGSQWSEHVSRAGQQYTDPPVA
jgi:hypothetical protein